MNKKERQIVFEKYGGKCAYCGCELTGKWQADHLIPQSNFKSCILNKIRVPAYLRHLEPHDCDHIDNMMPACCSCNNFKSTFHLELFREEIAAQVGRFRKYHPTFRLAERYGLVQEIPVQVKFYFETL